MSDLASNPIQEILDSDTTVIRISAELSAKSMIKRLESEGCFATLVDQAPVISKDTLLHALYQSCQFPAYFGFNWDALEDFLKDFSWLIAEAYILMFQDYAVLKERAPEVAETFLSITHDVAETRKTSGRKPLKLVLLNSEED